MTAAQRKPAAMTANRSTSPVLAAFDAMYPKQRQAMTRASVDSARAAAARAAKRAPAQEAAS